MKTSLRETVQSTAPEAPGVYVLRLRNKTVYVGQSQNMRNRVTRHLTTTEFDSFTCEPCDVAQLAQKEKDTILTLRPTRNRKMCPWLQQKLTIVGSFSITPALWAAVQEQADARERGNKSAYICNLIEADIRAVKKSDQKAINQIRVLR